MLYTDLQTETILNGFNYGAPADDAPTLAAYVDEDDDVEDEDDDLEEDDLEDDEDVEIAPDADAGEADFDEPEITDDDFDDTDELLEEDDEDEDEEDVI